MSLHNEIMNIPTGQLQEIVAIEETNPVLVYRMGHRDARHAAAELSLKYEHLIEELSDHFGKGIVDMFKRKCGL